MKRFSNLIIVLVFVALLSGCATRPYFAIENKSENEVIIEMVFDSLKLKETVAQFIRAKTHQYSHRNNCHLDPECNSIRNTLTQSVLEHYIYDSLPMNSFFLFAESSGQIEEFQINPIELVEKDHYNETFARFNQTVLDYYHYDSSFVKKIINEGVITLYLLTNKRFIKQCHASGDASCGIDDAFPNVKELKIVIQKDNVITLTKQNFKLILKNKDIQNEGDSYVFEIE